jgi:hypothetical protein
MGRSSLSHTAVEMDQRAVYTTSVNKFFWARTDKVWAVAKKVLKEQELNSSETRCNRK